MAHHLRFSRGSPYPEVLKLLLRDGGRSTGTPAYVNPTTMIESERQAGSSGKRAKKNVTALLRALHQSKWANLGPLARKPKSLSSLVAHN